MPQNRDMKHYIVYTRSDQKAEIYTTLRDAAAHVGVSEDTLSRRFKAGRSYENAAYLVAEAGEINKNFARSRMAKAREIWKHKTD